ncbi:MAG: hypothetical protein BMS9Abin23_0849 [Thermodesulfobacteriota bacterium]|nr:MAG: hypothetical protein BMS9Abin23_0849 [Thermodesulfobacteriota bacterium]
MTTLKQQHIKFKKGPAGSPEDWVVAIKKIAGVTSVSIDAEKGDVFVEYDLSKCREQAIENWMVRSGFVLEDGLLERVKRGWIHYTEENEQDALTAEAGSCCDIDSVEKKRKEIEGE